VIRERVAEATTLGVDLSTNPRLTALCLIDWSDIRPATVRALQVGATDEEIHRFAASAAQIGIDAPFGWPRPWAAAVAVHRPGSAFSAEGSSAELTLRYTDKWIAANVGIRPLSVAANLIGATAIRCARIVAALGRSVDTGEPGRSGSVSEVYPAAALKRWGQSWSLYKGKRYREARVALIAALEEAGLPVQLKVSDREQLAASDDALDALLASLIARATATGLTDDCPPDAVEVAREEGWIRVPAIGTSLRDLERQ
jgi:predicted nuclease with RNAse H fold